MALSEYEEMVVADLEAQFQADAPTSPNRDFGRLALPLICLLCGVMLLVAARNVGLVIRISDLWGFTTASVTSGLALAGHGVLLGSAFLFGRVMDEGRRRREDGPGSPTTEVRRETVQSP
ncbi:MAG: hypothetical protein M3357_10295 [Actinomycetota bacterium]|nr:hypothetical protein [Actinomycetota bacterium]